MVTNKTPNAPYRGAGRPETVFAMDRAVDCLARELGHGPGRAPPPQLPDRGRPAVRSRHPVPRRQPARLRQRRLPGRARRALAAVGLRRRSAREQAALGSRRVHRGDRHLGLRRGHRASGRSRARRARRPSGHAFGRHRRVRQGQGHETSFAQIAADALGVPLEWITVIGGDTAAIPFGVGTFASRSAVTAGSSIHEAARERAGQGRAPRRPRCWRRRRATSRSRRHGAVRGAPGSAIAAGPRVARRDPDASPSRG